MTADEEDDEEKTPHLRRVLREASAPGLMRALTERLPLPDLQTLLLAVFRRRASGVTPSRLLGQYERNRFVRPSSLDPVDLARAELVLHQTVARHGFTGLTLSPLCPLGTNSAVATVDQHKVVSTVRNTEVVADATNALALECAVRRRQLMRRDVRSRIPVRLAAVHRVVRAQVFDGPGMTAHFTLMGMCTAGRDEGSFRFESAAMAEHIAAHLDVLGRLVDVGPRSWHVHASVTDLTGGRHRAALRERVLDRIPAEHPGVTADFDDHRTRGRGYYTGACFELRLTSPSGQTLSIADGGVTRWTAALLANAKERLMVSGLGVELLLRARTEAVAGAAPEAASKIPGKIRAGMSNPAPPVRRTGERRGEEPRPGRGVTMPRFLTLIRIDEQNLPAEDPGPEFQERMNALLEEITKAGVMLDTAGLLPTSQATRITWSGGKLNYTDGPFTETKEVVGGYSLIQAKDKAEAMEWARRFLEIHPAGWEVTAEVREIEEG